MNEPLVSIITPVHNNAEHLGECIESVLAQTYQNWDCTILNNASTDDSLTVAQRYAQKDRRIHVVSTQELLPVIQNHNRASRYLSPDAKYCKFVFADDWISPECLQEMVSLSEENPSVGVVGAYGTDGKAVLWTGVRGAADRIYPSTQRDVLPGQEACRNWLRGGPYVFGSMTSLLIRADLVRARTPLFNEDNLHADVEACFDLLQEADFGFVHKVLTFTRPRKDSLGAFAADFDSIILGNLVVLLKYGPKLVDSETFARYSAEALREYHRTMALNILRLRPKKFWTYHRDTLSAFGTDLDRSLLTKMLLAEILRCVGRPLHTAGVAWQWWKRAIVRAFSGLGRKRYVTGSPD